MNLWPETATATAVPVLLSRSDVTGSIDTEGENVRALIAGVCLVWIAAVPARAQAPAASSHVRSAAPDLRRAIADVTSRSPTFRALVDELEHSDVVVYVRVCVLSLILDGRLAFVSAQPGQRFLVIELAYKRPLNFQMTRLAHELQHAVEIARAPWVVNAATLETHYQRIGFRANDDVWPPVYETADAGDVAERVRRELAQPVDAAR